MFFAMGGTGALVSALGQLLRDQGAEIRTGATVAEIEFDSRRATGVVLDDGERIRADLVVSNADPMHLYDRLVPKATQASTTRLKRRYSRLSMGLYVLYFGTRRRYDDVAHHTIWLGKRYRELLDDIFKRHILADDFSLYLHRPTATDPSFAPAGCDSFYVLAPVPNLKAAIDWCEAGSKLRDRIVDALAQSLLPDLHDHITADFFHDPGRFRAGLFERSRRGVFDRAALHPIGLVPIPQQGRRPTGTLFDRRRDPSWRRHARGALFGQGGRPARARSALGGEAIWD